MAELNFGKIGVLMGGPSSEREISLKSGRAVLEALKAAGLDALAVDVTTDERLQNESLFRSLGIDCAFICLHGYFGEDGRVQEILEGMKMPYTGSGVQASRLAMDKTAAHARFQGAGLRVPRWMSVSRRESPAAEDIQKRIGLPLVVKPVTNGSSIGLSLVEHEADIEKALREAFRFDERALIEEYIKGKELTVGILDEAALPVVQIVPKNRFFDYEAKYKAGMSEYLVPAPLAEAISAQVRAAGLLAHKSLGCYGFSRVDIILDEHNTPFVLELNSIPGFTPLSLLPKAARAAGIEFDRLCIRLLELAWQRHLPAAVQGAGRRGDSGTIV